MHVAEVVAAMQLFCYVLKATQTCNIYKYFTFVAFVSTLANKK
jgi:hypothetical protein